MQGEHVQMESERDLRLRGLRSADAERSEEDQKMLRQIMLDIPRTNPGE